MSRYTKGDLEMMFAGSDIADKAEAEVRRFFLWLMPMYRASTDLRPHNKREGKLSFSVYDQDENTSCCVEVTLDGPLKVEGKTGYKRSLSVQLYGANVNKRVYWVAPYNTATEQSMASLSAVDALTLQRMLPVLLNMLAERNGEIRDTSNLFMSIARG